MRPLRLEVFNTDSQQDHAAEIDDLNALEEARLASYEQGYTAGWDDSVAAQNEEKTQMAADLSHNLQSLNFTYHEARAHVLKGLEPLLVDLVEHFLPGMARSALAPIVLKVLLPLAETAADTPVQIMFNAASRDVIETLVEQANGPPFTLIEEPTLGEGQVFLRLGANETRVDLDGAIAEVKAALDDFLTLISLEKKNG